MFRSGFVSVIGRPNVGKSTLLNRIIGEKISIVSDKPQTTRTKIQLIYNEENLQVVFLDTPGIQMPRNKLGDYMMKLSKSTLQEVDLILFLIDCSESIGKMDNYILEQLDGIKTPVLLVLNKVDTAPAETVDAIVRKYEAMNRFEEIVPISALEGTNVENLIDAIRERMPEGPQYFPLDMVTDQPERNIIAEIIREKALLNLSEEIPHGIYVGVEKIEKRKGKELVDVHATIFVEKKSHKGMVIGKNGAMISKIGSQAREDVEKLLSTHINLQLWVKIEKNWRDDPSKVKRFGYIQ